MIVSDIGQARVFLINILFGVLCVVLFDIFSVLVKRYGKSSGIINLFDCLFFVLAFALVLFAGVKYNLGAFRYYQILGLLLGILLHWSIFSGLERRLFVVLLDIFIKTVRFVGRAVWLPCLWVLKLVFTPVAYGEDKMMGSLKKLEKRARKVQIKHEKKKKTVKKRIKMI